MEDRDIDALVLEVMLSTDVFERERNPEPTPELELVELVALTVLGPTPVQDVLGEVEDCSGGNSEGPGYGQG